jgi:hypothetical protein
VDNETVELLSAATKVSGGERRRHIRKEYFCLPALLILCHVVVQKIYRNREHHIPIPYLFVRPSTVATFMEPRYSAPATL